MDKNSFFGELLEQGKTAVSDSSKSVLDTTKKQITGDQNSQKSQNQPNIQNQELQSQLSEESREIIKDFYAPSAQNVQKSDVAMDKEAELAKVRREIAELKSSLHQETYVKPLFDYEGKYKQNQAQAQVQEEQQEEQKKQMEELQLQQKKQQDIDTFRKQRGIEIRASAG